MDGVRPLWPARRRVIGSNGSNTFFSCTWYEHKKNAHATVAKPHGSNSFFGRNTRIRQGGRIAVDVATRAARWTRVLGYT